MEHVMEMNEEYLPVEFAENEHYRKEMIAIVDSLPFRQREAIMLHYYGDLSINECAEDMRVDPSTVSKYLALAREKLKKEMKKKEFDTDRVWTRCVAPTGLVLAGALDREAATHMVDPAMLARMLTKCEATIAHGSTITAMATATKAILWKIFGTVTALSVVGGTAAGIMLKDNPKPPIDIVIEAPNSSIAGVVEFSGGEDQGDGIAYLNPRSAIPQAESENGAVIVEEWWITEEDDSDILYSGEGSDLGVALIELRSKGDNVYMVFFLLRDEEGFTYEMGRNFQVGAP
jgi:hypothetical protein